MGASPSYYCTVGAMERAGYPPRLAYPLEAKRRIGKSHRTDTLGAEALAILLAPPSPTGSARERLLRLLLHIPLVVADENLARPRDLLLLVGQ
jgi:hypothetical protein